MVGEPVRLEQVCQQLAEWAPLSLAESWDNVGLLVGDRSASVSRIMTCLTISPPVVAEALRESAELIIAHHPLPFQPLKRITTDNTTGRMLWDLIGAQVAIYSAHTAFDSAAAGINQSWAERFELTGIEPLIAGEVGDSERLAGLGAGRCGRWVTARRLDDVARLAKATSGAKHVRVVGDPSQPIRKLAFACGSGGSFLSAASRRGCDALVTGESNFHGCLEAESTGVGLVLVGHYSSERFAMERLAEELSGAFPAATVWASRDEADPLWDLDG